VNVQSTITGICSLYLFRGNRKKDPDQVRLIDLKHHVDKIEQDRSHPKKEVVPSKLDFKFSSQ
jgi:hypothetical protein